MVEEGILLKPLAAVVAVPLPISLRQPRAKVQVAGGGSYATGAAVSCTIADQVFDNRNGAVEIWFFTGGC